MNLYSIFLITLAMLIRDAPAREDLLNVTMLKPGGAEILLGKSLLPMVITFSMTERMNVIPSKLCVTCNAQTSYDCEQTDGCLIISKQTIKLDQLTGVKASVPVAFSRNATTEIDVLLANDADMDINEQMVGWLSLTPADKVSSRIVTELYTDEKIEHESVACLIYQNSSHFHFGNVDQDIIAFDKPWYTIKSTTETAWTFDLEKAGIIYNNGTARDWTSRTSLHAVIDNNADSIAIGQEFYNELVKKLQIDTKCLDKKEYIWCQTYRDGTSVQKLLDDWVEELPSLTFMAQSQRFSILAKDYIDLCRVDMRRIYCRLQIKPLPAGSNTVVFGRPFFSQFYPVLLPTSRELVLYTRNDDPEYTLLFNAYLLSVPFAAFITLLVVLIS